MAYRKPIIAPPWGGWNSSAPALSLPTNSFKTITNWLINKQRLIPFPKTQLAPFNLPNSSALWGARTFLDLNANFHSLLLGDSGAFYINPTGLTLDPIPPTWPTFKVPYAMEVFQNQVYFSNGNPNQSLLYVKGDNANYVAGDTFGSCYFLGKLSARLLMINLVENQFPFVNKIRWSAVNNANEWDNTVDYTAGSTIIPEVEDQLTGWATINNTGFAFRNNGITAFSPTGSGLLPFFIENFSIGPTGIGCQYPYSLSVYGAMCAFAALDDIYLFSGQAPQPIGGAAKKSIIKDLNSSTSFTTSTIMGTIAPGIDYLAYWLMCPQGTGSNLSTTVWIYHFDDQSWVRETFTGWLHTIANVATT